ncbi:hypothetical protein HDE_09335 [Halotydeus destructor]|nr:hypothetical protein HDE_09335 [Halotydeus destructor]
MPRFFGRPVSWGSHLKAGLREWPEVYAGMGYILLSSLGCVWIGWYTEKHNDKVCRYKKHYMIMRPSDERVQMYPKIYLTDKQYLSADHPKTTKDLKVTQRPYLYVHSNPKLRNPPQED